MRALRKMSIVSMNLTNEIQNCTKCLNDEIVGSDRLNTDQKPYVLFNVERKWKPDRVKVLFIAESPPSNGKQRYFYNPEVIEKRTNLRKEILKYLNLDSLKEFKNKDHFLVDTIKCRLNKSKKIKTPLRITSISKSCAEQFLRREIEELKPHTIFVLGNTAKKALQRFSEFKELKEHKITEEHDEKLSGYRVILCVFPNRRTEGKYRNQIRRAFAKIRQ